MLYLNKEMKILHRDLRPCNVFLEEKDGKLQAIIGNFNFSLCQDNTFSKNECNDYNFLKIIPIIYRVSILSKRFTSRIIKKSFCYIYIKAPETFSNFRKFNPNYHDGSDSIICTEASGWQMCFLFKLFFV